MLLACVLVHAVCGLGPALLPQLYLFLAIRCLTGVCCCCINICAFSLGKRGSAGRPVSAESDWTAVGRAHMRTLTLTRRDSLQQLQEVN